MDKKTIETKVKKRALCISGGGAKGSFAGGLANKLYDNGYRWSNYYGTSTGALLSSFIPSYDFKTLKQIYTNVTNKDIFNKPPFNQKGKIRYLRVLWRTLIGKKSIGEAKNLFELIKKTYTNEIHNELLLKNKIIVACVTNFTKGIVEYGYNNMLNYSTFIKYIFASASVPVAMDLVNINNEEYLDGGVMEHIPLQQAIDDGVDEIDAIILRPDYSEIKKIWESENVLNVAMRSLELLMKEISETDLIIGKLKNTLNKDIKINLYYVPENLTGNSLIFDPEVMKEWWDLGYDVEIIELTDKAKKLKASNNKINVINHELSINITI